MPDLKKAQATNLKNLLSDEGLTETQFSDLIGMTIQSVSRWLNGKTTMTVNSAKAINARFPRYSVEYLLGATEWNNDQIAYLNNAARTQKIESVHALIEMSGFEVDVLLGSEAGRIDEDMCYSISNGKSSARLSEDGFKAFADEVSAYVAMRLNLMIERGCY